MLNQSLFLLEEADAIIEQVIVKIFVDVQQVLHVDVLELGNFNFGYLNIVIRIIRSGPENKSFRLVLALARFAINPKIIMKLHNLF